MLGEIFAGMFPEIPGKIAVKFGKNSAGIFVNNCPGENFKKLGNVSEVIQLSIVAVHSCVPSGLHVANVDMHGTHVGISRSHMYDIHMGAIYSPTLLT